MASAPLTGVQHPLLAPAPLRLEAQEAERMTGGRWLGPPQSAEVHGAVIDSRHITAGCLFACLQGTRADGHDHALAAAAAGAALILASRALPEVRNVPVLVVRNVAEGLARLAMAVRRSRMDATWIGITGSSGKTTVKELIAAACGADAQTHATFGNLNNHLGVPLTILSTPLAARHVVVEMGANHQREIASLADIVQPQIGVITCLGPAHLEGFGGIEGVAKGKSELFAALPAGAPAIIGISGLELVASRLGLSIDRLLVPVRQAAAGRHLMLVGSPEHPVSGTVDADGITLVTPAGRIRLPLLGAHNLANATVAYHAAVASGIDPATVLRGLGSVHALPGRLSVRPAGDHQLLDDSYNANPGSMIAGLQVLIAGEGQHLAVLGAMGELGEDRERGHQLVGEEAARLGISVIVVGQAAEPIAQAYRDAHGAECLIASDRTQAVRLALEVMGRGPTRVLVKGSRSAGLEQVVDELLRACGSDRAC